MVRALTRRLAVIATLVLVVGLLLGSFLQVSATRTLEQAEALQFRRLLVSRQDEQTTFRFFFATNRAEIEGASDLTNRLTNQRQPALSLGYFDTGIEPSLGIGMLVNPTDWFQNEEIQLLQVNGLAQGQFIEEIRAQVDATPDRSLLITINGFREKFPSALRKTAFLAHVLDINSPMLVFDWPGDQGSTPRGYGRAQAMARESAADLASLLKLVVQEIGPDRLSVMANSMGAEVLVGAFTLLYNDDEFRDADPEFREVVLTAPDVSHAEFGRQFSDEISALTRELTIYVSSNDTALLMSRILNRERRLGESTFNPRNPDQLEEAARAWELITPGDSSVAIIDITPVNRTRNFHNFSLETPEFFDDLFLRLTNDENPESRRKYRVQTSDGREYWVLTRGR